MTESIELSDKDYTAIGRALVENAVKAVGPRLTDDHVKTSKAIEQRGYRVSVRFADGGAEALPRGGVVCCVCVSTDFGYVICRGKCCG